MFGVWTLASGIFACGNSTEAVTEWAALAEPEFWQSSAEVVGTFSLKLQNKTALVSSELSATQI